MQLTIKYFGMLAEATSIDEEIIQTDPCMVSQIVEALTFQHPKIKGKDFKIAVNQQLVDFDYVIQTEAEIALLPPFAGG